MKNSCKYDAEVQPQQAVTTEVFLFSQLYFHEVSEINSARKQATFILKRTIKINNRAAF